MKVSVITQHAVCNYGSVLQTYATQTIFEQMGCQAEVVDFRRRRDLLETRAREALFRNALTRRLKFLWSRVPLAKTVLEALLERYLKRKQHNLDAFVQENIRLTPRRYLSIQELQEDPPQADLYVTGSDQVWNSSYNGGVEPAYFLEYAPEGKRRISLAASIGKTELSAEEGNCVAALLQKYSAVSVREESGAKLLGQLGIPAEPVLDPTLFLDGQWWRKLADYGKCPDRPYLLIYQLNRNKAMDSYAQRLAQQKGWEILRIGFLWSDKKRVGKCIYCPTIPEFLGLFDRAACCLTDSFHATAFSVNLGTDFISVKPPKFETRIQDFLRRLGAENRILEDFDDMEIADCLMDREAIAMGLERERARAWEFVRTVLQ